MVKSIPPSAELIALALLVRLTEEFFEKSRGGNKRRYVTVDVVTAPPVVTAPVPSSTFIATDSVTKVGARLCDFADNWRSVTDDRWVLSTVRDELFIDLLI